VHALVFAGEVVSPVGVEVAVVVVDERAELQDGHGAGEAPRGLR
jgi:hypothetical protein